MRRVTLVKNTVAHILKQLAWRAKPSPKGGSDPQLTVPPSLEYKSKSNNILLTYFRKFTFYWPDVNCHHVFYRPYGHDLSSSAMGQNYQTPITLLPGFKKEREIMSVLPQEMASSARGRESNLLLPDIHCLKVVHINSHSNLFSASQLLPFPSCQLH